ncbi:hypothetical protein NP233_g229 [Leucocoprinus birnbaumii]|uniref:Uncharacterized protein n=1 Tax=Leucocoprinus birnbaumii TaxID=56174 RepID=A0AAD5W725_9AGAR|nr:hypothetical protein NP233_g229 [Leucocoprinus birnbaumii]
MTSFEPTPEPSPAIASTFLATFTGEGTSIITETLTFNPTFNLPPPDVPTPVIPTAVTPSTQTDNNHQNMTNAGAIVGGVFGALVVLAAAFAFVWFRRRSSKHGRNRATGRLENSDHENDKGSPAQPVDKAQNN